MITEEINEDKKKGKLISNYIQIDNQEEIETSMIVIYLEAGSNNLPMLSLISYECVHYYNNQFLLMPCKLILLTKFSIIK